MMNWAHIHLLVNDVPILASVFAALFFLLALRAESRDTWARAGMLLLGIASISAFAAFMTGSPASEVIEGQAHTSNRALSEHHVRATIALAAAGLSAVAAIAALVITRRTSGSYSRRLVTVLFALTTLSAACLGWTGLAGGRISHPELQLPGDREGGPAHHH
jgi:uncharacterized membrane protein